MAIRCLSSHFCPLRWLLISLLLSGCTQSIVQHKLTAISQDSRVQVIVIHATEETFEDSLRILTKDKVSSHYLINREPAEVWQLVDEDRRAWHAGTSAWQGRKALNSASIGIELVSTEHSGVKEEPFTDAQMAKLIALLKDIQSRHHVRPDRIVGHGEVQPDHKTDPGRLFPWMTLVDAGLIPWPDPQKVLSVTAQMQSVPSVDWWQKRFALAGYDCPATGIWDDRTLKILQVFRDKYEPRKASQPVSVSAAALLQVITSQDGLQIKNAHGQWEPFKVL